MKHFGLIVVLCTLFAPLVNGQQRTVVVRRGPAMAPRQPTERVFVSQNGKFRVVAEETTGESLYEPKVVVTMKRSVTGETNILWRASFTSMRVGGWRDSQVFVSDDGSFCVAPSQSGRWTILKKDTHFDIPGKNSYERWEGFFTSPDQKLFDVDTLHNEPSVRFWNRDEDRWIAYSIATEQPITATQELTKAWNESMRKKILDQLTRAQTEEIRERLNTVSSKLSELTKAASGFIKGSELRDLHYQFLAVRKNPADRPWFERLLKSAPGSPLAAPWNGNYMGIARLNYNFVAGPSDLYSYQEISAPHLAADSLLAVFDGKITNKTSYGARPQKLYYLGRISGAVKFPIPLVKRNGQVRIVVVPESNIFKEWWLNDFSAIEAAVIPTASDQMDLTDEIGFDFATIAAGKYFAKAIFDLRSPISDLHQAGPGDYESAWTGPIDLKMGAAITNVFLLCTNTVAGGESYYAADRIISRQWRETGEISLHKAIGGVNGTEIFSGPPPQWIVATNFEAAGPKFELMRISVIGWPFTKLPDSYNYSDTRPLSVTWRRGIRPNGAGACEPAFLRILDEHGCSYAPSKTNANSRMVTTTFRQFPRSSKYWRLVGYGPHGVKDVLFDFTLTNRVRTEPLQLDPRELPLELNFGKVVLKVESIAGEGSNTWMESSFFENGVKSEAWRVGSIAGAGIHFSDADGNEIDPANMCRVQGATRVFGYVAENDAAPSVAFPFEFTVPRVKPWAPNDP